jgi:hypothetical protein
MRFALLFAACALVLSPPIAARMHGPDGEFEGRQSSHFVLHQDVGIPEAGGLHGSRHFEQQVLAELERTYDALGEWLALRPQRRIDVLIYDPAQFDAAFAGRVRFRIAGFYQGVIRVRGDTGLTDPLARVLHHELVHAALDSAAPTLWLPGWVNEGVAEWFEKRVDGQRSLTVGERAALAGVARTGELHSLAALASPSFAGLDARQAAVAYLESYALIDYLARQEGERSLARFLAELIHRRNLDRALHRVYHLDAATLEARFARQLG